MADSREEGDVLVEEAYEYLVRNVPGGCKRIVRKRCIQRKAQKFVVKGTLRRRRRRRARFVHFNLANAHNCVVRKSWVVLYYRQWK